MPSKPQPVSPIQLNNMVLQHLILSELMKISDLLAKKEPASDYDIEIQKRVRVTMRKFVKIAPRKGTGAANVVGDSGEVKKVG